MVDQITVENKKTFIDDNAIINLPSGQISLTMLRQVLNILPFEITLADATDQLVYYSDNDQRLERRQATELGTPLVSLFPDADQPAITSMLAELHQGAADHFEQWYPQNGQTVYNNFYAIRDIDGTYVGTLKFTGDISRIQGFRGIRTVFNSGKTDK